MQKLVTLLIVAGIWLVPILAAGQGYRRDGRGRPDRPATPEEAAQRAARTQEFLRRLDTNGNGMIDAEEVTGGAKYFLERVLTRAGLEAKYPLALSRVQEALGNQSGSPSAGAPAGAGPSTTATGPPLVPAFGEARPPTSPSGFGPPATAWGRPAAGPPASAAPATPSPQPGNQVESQIRALAAAIIQKFDKDGNGRLDRSEWPGDAGWGTFDEANRLGGEFVTLDELITHLTNLQRQGKLPAGALGAVGGSSSLVAGSPGAASAARKSGRFLRPTERLPAGLPEWFPRKDADGDGQVSMAEYAREWSAAVADEFARYDLNGDGIITPRECLKAERQPR